MRDKALAIQNFHGVYRRFPSVYISNVDSTGIDIGPCWGWGGAILPQVEQAPLYNQIDFKLKIESPINSNSRLQKPLGFMCPSDNSPDRWQIAMRSLSTGAFISNICEASHSTCPAFPHDLHLALLCGA